MVVSTRLTLQRLMGRILQPSVRGKARRGRMVEVVVVAAATVWGAYVFIQSLIFALPVLVMIIFAVGMIALIAGLWLFTDYAAQKQWKASILAIPIQIMGRYSLESYVLHVCLFHVIRLLFFQNPNPITGTS